MPEILIEPFTYYRSSDSTRAFLVADAPVPADNLGMEGKAPHVVLIEWGKTRHQASYVLLETFSGEIAAGRLILFTPKL